jgi:hypothetical protein
MMGVHVIGKAVQDEGDSFAPRSSAKTFVFGTRGRIPQNPGIIDLSALDHE